MTNIKKYTPETIWRTLLVDMASGTSESVWVQNEWTDKRSKMDC
jgi:hypothetical protein